MSALTMKFGGSTVGTTTALTQVLSIVMHESKRWDRLLLVVSALEGVTDSLIEAAHLAQISNRRGYRRIIGTIRSRHLALIDKLPLGPNERSALQADIDRLLFDVINISQAIEDTTEDALTPDTLDAVIGVGERLSARIIAALLRQNDIRGVAIDTTDLIVTDGFHGNARPNLNLTCERANRNLLPMLDRGIVPVLTGFIGGTQGGKPTTLGRGGSDYTASIISVCLNVDEVWIWTDVDGIMSADPREVIEAQVIPELSYAEMAELAYFGAKVLHSRMVGPLREKDIHLRVKNVYKPQHPGTLISTLPSREKPVKAITTISGIALRAPRSGPLHEIIALVDQVMTQTIGSNADVAFSTQSSSGSFICFVIPTTAGPDVVHTVETALRNRLSGMPMDIPWTVQVVSIVTIIGAELNGFSDWTGRVLGALEGTRLLSIAQGASACSLSMVVEPYEAERITQRLHRLILNAGSDSRKSGKSSDQ